MKKISRRNFLLASGAVTIGAALAACGGSMKIWLAILQAGEELK